MKLLKNNKGFTLVELIVVIVILGVLAGVGAPQIFKYIEKSRVSAIASNVAIVESVVNNLYAESGNITTAFGGTPLTATAAIDARLANNKTLASMNLTVTAMSLATAVPKTMTLTLENVAAGIDGNEFNGKAGWAAATAVGADPVYTITITD